MSLITININGKDVMVEEGSMILDAAQKLNIKIPTLCNMRMQDGKTENCKGTCRVCVVEVEGRRNLAASCSTPATNGMKIKTNSIRAINARKNMVGLLLSNHPMDCLKCEKNNKCELQKMAADLGVYDIKYEGEKLQPQVDKSSSTIVRDMEKCILCRRCVTACNEIQKVYALTPAQRGFETTISTFNDKEIANTECTSCGQCVIVCPTGALREVYNYEEVWKVLSDKDKVVVVSTAPAVRAALGEEFGIEAGTPVTKLMVGALRSLGFDKVFDTNFGADLTIMEEASEFVSRFTTGQNLPLITSCCPGWVNFIEKNYPEQINLASSCKSPQQMFGAVAKTYFAEKLGIPKEKLVVVSVMPCVAKKYEADLELMNKSGVKDIDIVITTRELAKMIKEAGLDLKSVEESEFDSPLGESTGAGDIFGTSGGVMEAALRTAYEFITKEQLENVNFESVRGIEGVKEATVTVAGKDVRLAVANSLGNAKKIMDEIQNGENKYDFIEIMACPGGCINGGGQPYIKGNREIIQKRSNALYAEDAGKVRRKSHENPDIIRLYEEYLGEPNGHKAHELLHREYEV